jgi:hypothetical protein
VENALTAMGRHEAVASGSSRPGLDEVNLSAVGARARIGCLWLSYVLLQMARRDIEGLKRGAVSPVMSSAVSI